MNRFDNKVAIVTGASKGLGRAIAERLAAEGAEVLVTARNAGPLEELVARLTADGARAVKVVGDVVDAATREEIVSRALAEWGRIDVLINNAGVYHEAEYLDVDEESWNYDLDVDLNAPALLSISVGREMAKMKAGAIVNVASIDGHSHGGPYVSYGVAKAGLIALTQIGAVQLAPHGIRCNSISPGWADTPMVQSATTPAMLQTMRTAFRRVPLGRLLTPEEIAAAAAFLASDEASGITGADLLVDGGTVADLHIIPTLE